MPPSIFQGGVVGGQRSVGLGGLNALAATPIIGPSAATVPAGPPSKLTVVTPTPITGDVSTGQGGQSVTALSDEALAAVANTGQGQSASSAGSESLAGSSVTAQGQTAAAAGSEGVSAQSGTGQGQGATSAGSEAVSAQSSTAQGGQGSSSAGSGSQSGQGVTAQGQSAAASGSESVSGTVTTAQGSQSVTASDIPAIVGVADTGQGGQEASSNGLVSLGVGQLVDAGGDGAWKHRIVWPTPKPMEGPEAITGDAVTAQSSNVIAIGSLGVKAFGAARQAQISHGMGDTYDYELEQFVLLMAEAA